MDGIDKLIPIATAVAGYLGGLSTEWLKLQIAARHKKRTLVNQLYAEGAHTYSRIRSFLAGDNSTPRKLQVSLSVLYSSLTFDAFVEAKKDATVHIAHAGLEPIITFLGALHYLTTSFAIPRPFDIESTMPKEQRTILETLNSDYAALMQRDVNVLTSHVDLITEYILRSQIDGDLFVQYLPEHYKEHGYRLLAESKALEIFAKQSLTSKPYSDAETSHGKKE
jgi:hypothetical protein